MAIMLCYEGRLSLYCFLGGMASLLVFYGAEAFLHEESIWTKVALSVGYYISLNVIIRIRYNPRDYQVSQSL